jgi:hypothetical protein
MIFHFRGTQREAIYVGSCLYLSDNFHCSTDHCYFTVSQLVYWINSMHTMRFSNNLHQVCSMPKNLSVLEQKKKRAKIDIQNCLREENFGFINNYMSRSCLPFWSTCVHPWFLVGFVLLNL